VRLPVLLPVLLSVLLSVLLGACAANEPRIPPSELKPITQDVSVGPVWSRNLDDSGRGRFEPLVTEASVTVADEDGVVVRYERQSGDVLWRVALKRQLVSAVGGNDELVFVAGRDGWVLALDAESGDESWRTQVSSDVLAPVALAFDTAVVRSADGRVVRLNLADGTERWSSSWTPPALTINGYGRPLVVDGGVLVGLDDGRVVALNSANGRVLWEAVLSRPAGRSEVERMVDVDADIAVDTDGIYAVNFQGRAVRLEPSRGGVDWAVEMSSTSGLTVGDAKVVIVDDEGHVHALDKSSGSTLWTQEALRGRKPSAPALVGGSVVVGDFEGYLHVLDANTGLIQGRREIAHGAIRVQPQGDQRGLVVQSIEGEVRVVRLSSSGSS
jgi:outer membrane protein assembly factor BamB